MELCPFGHRVLAATRRSEDGESSFTRLGCEDPTCGWCVTELIGDSATLVAEGLTKTDVYGWIKPDQLRRDASRESLSDVQCEFPL